MSIDSNAFSKASFYRPTKVPSHISLHAISFGTTERRLPLACQCQKLIWNRGLVRILSPYLQNKNGIGHIPSAMNPSRELPQPRPRASYIGGPARGNSAPARDRRTVFAAIADAACRVNASTRYVDIGIWCSLDDIAMYQRWETYECADHTSSYKSSSYNWCHPLDGVFGRPAVDE